MPKYILMVGHLQCFYNNLNTFCSDTFSEAFRHFCLIQHAAFARAEQHIVQLPLFTVNSNFYIIIITVLLASKPLNLIYTAHE